jgi:hypothetical protein
MKQILVLCASMALVATSAFGVGIDLTVGACGNNPGASSGANIDCAAGGTVTLLGVFQPYEAYDDIANGYVLIGIDGILDMQVAGELSATGSAAFWDWDQNDGCSPVTYPPNPPDTAVFSMNRKAPTTGCTSYFNTFDIAGSLEAAVAVRRSTNAQRIRFACARPASSPLPTLANQKLFAAQFLIDGSLSHESGGGTCGGCPVFATVIWSSCIPGVLNGAPTTGLVDVSLFSNIVEINRYATPTKKPTWGQLKSLYR